MAAVDRVTAPTATGAAAVDLDRQLEDVDVGRSDVVETDSGEFRLAESATASRDLGTAVDTRVERTETPGPVARTIDAATDAFETANPGLSGTIDLAAASVRSESGAPIPGTGLTTPGARNFDNFREALDPAAGSIDRTIADAVDRATFDPAGAPADLSDVPVSDPAAAAVGATLGTEAGRRGTQAGITTGVQSFNPAAGAQDAATFAEVGISGTDRVLDADADEIQTGLDVGEAVGETALEAGPPLAGAAVVEDPSRGFEAGAAGLTIGATGALAPSAAGAAGRAGRRAADDVFDSGGLRRLLDDDRGQLDGSFGRRDSDEDTIEIGGSDIDPADDFDPQRVTRSEVLDAPEAGPRQPSTSFSQSFTQRSSAPSRRADVSDRFDRGESAAEANPSFGSRATFDRSDVPSDPLDRVGVDFGDLTASTRRVDDADASGGLLDPLDTRRPGEIEDSALEPVAAGAATGASVGGLLGERAREQAGEPLAGFDGVALGDLGDADTGSGVTGDEDGVGDLGGGLTGQGSETGVAPLEMIRATALTGTQAAQDTLAAQDQQGRLDAVGTGTGLGQRDIEQPNRGPTGRDVPTGGGFRPPRPPTIPTPDAEQNDEEQRFGTARDDDLLSSGIAEAEDIAEDFGFSGSSSGGLGFDIRRPRQSRRGRRWSRGGGRGQPPPRSAYTVLRARAQKAPAASFFAIAPRTHTHA